MWNMRIQYTKEDVMVAENWSNLTMKGMQDKLQGFLRENVSIQAIRIVYNGKEVI